MGSFLANFLDELSIDHLCPEAIAALVDGELSPQAEHRAMMHLVACAECRTEVSEQRAASRRLKNDSMEVHASGALLAALQKIPQISANERGVECSTRAGGASAEAGPGSQGGGKSRSSAPGGFTVDGCRIPETLLDRVDLLVRRMQRRSSGSQRPS